MFIIYWFNNFKNFPVQIIIPNNKNSTRNWKTTHYTKVLAKSSTASPQQVCDSTSASFAPRASVTHTVNFLLTLNFNSASTYNRAGNRKTKNSLRKSHWEQLKNLFFSFRKSCTCFIYWTTFWLNDILNVTWGALHKICRIYRNSK